MNASSYERDFKELYGHLLGACATYYSWKGLQEKAYEPLYDKAIYFWSAVLVALQNEWMINLAKCFENSSFSEQGRVISAYSILNHHPDLDRRKKAEMWLKKHDKIIRHIGKVRHNRLAHLNAKHLRNPKKLLERFPIKYGEVEELLNDLPELFSLLDPQSGTGYIISNYTEVPEREARDTIDKIHYFDTKDVEHIAKFAAGETDNPFFPPTK